MPNNSSGDRLPSQLRAARAFRPPACDGQGWEGEEVWGFVDCGPVWRRVGAVEGLTLAIPPLPLLFTETERRWAWTAAVGWHLEGAIGLN